MRDRRGQGRGAARQLRAADRFARRLERMAGFGLRLRLADGALRLGFGRGGLGRGPAIAIRTGEERFGVRPGNWL